MSKLLIGTTVSQLLKQLECGDIEENRELVDNLYQGYKKAKFRVPAKLGEVEIPCELDVADTFYYEQRSFTTYIKDKFDQDPEVLVLDNHNASLTLDPNTVRELVNEFLLYHDRPTVSFLVGDAVVYPKQPFCTVFIVTGAAVKCFSWTDAYCGAARRFLVYPTNQKYEVPLGIRTIGELFQWVEKRAAIEYDWLPKFHKYLLEILNTNRLDLATMSSRDAKAYFHSVKRKFLLSISADTGMNIDILSAVGLFDGIFAPSGDEDFFRNSIKILSVTDKKLAAIQAQWFWANVAREIQLEALPGYELSKYGIYNLHPRDARNIEYLGYYNYQGIDIQSLKYLDTPFEIIS